MKAELRPCICGKKPCISRGGPGNLVWYIECDNRLTENAEHQVTLQCGGTRDEAIAVWNTRKTEDALVAALAERDRLLKVFYESSSHFQNEDGGCDCADCQDVKEILGGK